MRIVSSVCVQSRVSTHRGDVCSVCIQSRVSSQEVRAPVAHGLFPWGIKRLPLGTGEMTQGLGVLADLAEDQNFSSHHLDGSSQLPVTLFPGESSALFWPSKAPKHGTYKVIQEHAQTH